MVVPYIMFIDIENKKYTPIVFYDTLYIDRYVKNQKGFVIPIEGDSYIYKKILYALDLLGYYVKWRLV